MARTPKRIPQDTLQKIVALREGHSSWGKIQQEIGLDWRTCKRAYEEWVRSKSIDELKAARRGIAEEEFRNHLHFLVALAEALAQTVGIPRQSSETRPASKVLDNLWENSRLKDYSAYGIRDMRASSEARSLLLGSLRTHTGGSVRWDALQEWQQAWDECLSKMARLRVKARGALIGVLNQQQILLKLRKLFNKQDTEEQWVNGVVQTVWEQILRRDDTAEFPDLELETLSGGKCRILFGREKFVAQIALDTALCQQVLEACKRAARSALSFARVEGMDGQVEILRERASELQRGLNPLLLGPLIMSTHCDLCPA